MARASANENKELILFLINKLNALELKSIVRDLSGRLRNTRRNRDDAVRGLISATFGAFLGTLVALNIEKILKYNFPKNILLLLSILIVYGIAYIVARITLIKFDKEQSDLEKEIYERGIELQKVDKKIKVVEDKLFSVDR